MKSLSLSPSFLTRVKKSAAETLAEVLIALVVLAVGAGGAMTLVIMSIRANVDAEERLVAYNLAREGVEAMRTIRDTNWLRFPGNRADCWDAFPTVTNPSMCSSNEMVEDAYAVYLDLANRASFMTWQVMGGASNAKTLEIETVGTDGFVYTLQEGCDGACDGGQSIYSRLVEITEKGTNGNGAEYMKVESTVEWESHGQTKSVVFYDFLTNY